MHAMSARTAITIESLECRALLSAGDVLHAQYTDVLNHSDSGGAVVRVAGGKLLQVGLSYDVSFTPVFSLARFNDDGTPDNTFNPSGSNVILNYLPDAGHEIGAVNAAAVDPASGRIVVVGRMGDVMSGDFFVAAFTPQGQLDASFNGNGVSINDFVPGESTEARALAIGGGGAIFVAGGAAVNDDFIALAHFNGDGTLDDAFGVHGFARTPTRVDQSTGAPSADIVHAMALDGDGKIILAGESLARFNGEDAAVIALQRYNIDGTIDTSFGAGGSVRFDVPAPVLTAVGDKAYSVVVNSDGTILVGGTTDGPIQNASDTFVLLKFDSHGNRDLAFGNSGDNGIVRTYFGGFSSALITDMAIQSDGAIVVGGNVFTCTDDSCGEGSNSFAVARYDASGDLDTDFGGSGVVFTQNFQGGRPQLNLATIALQPDAQGKSTIALGSWLTRDSDDLVLVRFALSGLAVKLAAPPTANEGDTVHLKADFSGALAEGVSFNQEQHRAQGTPAPTPTVSYVWTITMDDKADPVASGLGTGIDKLDIPFTPADNGTYHVLISINNGAASDSADITVGNVDPTATINGAPTTSDEGGGINLTSSVSDPGADTFTYAWSVTRNGSTFATGSDSTFSFTPDDDGSYVVTLTITDDDGGIGRDSKTVLVGNLNPTAAINGAPTESGEGSAINLTGFATDPGAADTFTYAWLVTKAEATLASGSESAFTFQPDDDGDYVVTLTVTDDDGGVGSTSKTISVSNLNPTAKITGAPTESFEGSAINLTSTVTDPGAADTFTYAWLVTENRATIASGSDSAFRFTPDDNGSYQVTLTVKDDDGGTASDSKTVNVTNLAPTALINGAPATSPEGSTINLTSAVSDPGAADTFTYAWSVTKNGNDFASGSAADFSFTPNDNGSYVVTLIVTDKDGGIGSSSSTITVTNLVPTATIGGAPASGSEGTNITLSGSASDPGSADTTSFAWSVAKNGNAFASGSGASFSFTPDDNGSYLVTLTVTDDDGGASTDSRNISVSNVAPTVTPISGATSGEQGASQTFNSSFTDPGSADTWTITWNFGDGTNQTISGRPGTLSASHTYVAAGTYTASLTVSDDDGGSASQSSSITITNSNTTTLTIQGTAGPDDITVKAGLNGALIVTLNGTTSTHTGFTQIVINAGAGDDRIKVNPEVTQNAVVFAGDGDDSIKTGSGNDIIVGGNGDDLLHGNDGRDILIGGRGSDRIVGNADSDILVAAYTIYGPNLAALTAIQSEWTSARSFGQRTANVIGRDVTIAGVIYHFAGPRNNGNTFFSPDGPNATVFDDGDVDILSGSADQDLFLFNSDTCVRDILTGLGNDEFAADIDFLCDSQPQSDCGISPSSAS